MPGIPWRLWKAQLYQESRLDPDARSPVGAEGIAQFMPATWTEVAKAMGYGSLTRRDAAASIEAGAYYMSRQRRAWDPAREFDRHKLAAASYNAGLGNIRKAQDRCADALSWDLVAPCLVEVTGRHSAETLGYIRMIWKWWAAMEARG
jgi:soluble lytic murein transglycosylase-like protein